MRDVLTITLAAVSRSELCYVSENEGFRFGKKCYFRTPNLKPGCDAPGACLRRTPHRKLFFSKKLNTSHVKCNMSIKMYILLCVFEGRCHKVL